MILFAVTLLLAGSVVQFTEGTSRFRRWTRQIEFDFVTWTFDAVESKVAQTTLGSASYIDPQERSKLVLEYMDLIRRASDLNGQIDAIYTDPSIDEPDVAAAGLLAELDGVRSRQDEVGPAAETILQEQVAVVLDDLDLNIGGTAFPPVSFQFSRLPLALIVSPRNIIQNEATIMLEPGLVIDDRAMLETEIETGEDVSALVVPVGGLGSYPTMVMQSGSFPWTVEVVAHEWIHNYLTLRPLGFNYSASAEMRTMNETTASILGQEIGRRVLEQYYPEQVPPPPPSPPAEKSEEEPPPPPAFDFRAEMRETRVAVDELLERGEIETAEEYMEERREMFWEQGYRIRRLNQAYFAFYGSYADQPGGAAGEDPVGAAVRELWARVGEPTRFLQTMAWINSFEELQKVLSELPTNPESGLPAAPNER